MTNITYTKCPCGNEHCKDYHLQGIGHFVQGSGFSASEAYEIVEAVNARRKISNFHDVKAFHEKFGLICNEEPIRLTKRKLIERVEFLREELAEFVEASGLELVTSGSETRVYHAPSAQNFAEQADALIDLVYVAMGTAVMMGLPWEVLWDDVQRANMSKVRGMTKRGHAVDVTKPEGWVGPKTQMILDEFGYKPEREEIDDAKN